MEQPASRRLYGVAVVIVIALLADPLPSGPTSTHLLFGDQHVFVPTAWSILANLAIFAVGGFVSRSRFIPVAAVFVILSSILGQYILYTIALPAGEVNIVSIAIGNSPSILILFVSAVVGAYVGEQVYARRTSLAQGAVEG